LRLLADGDAQDPSVQNGAALGRRLDRCAEYGTVPFAGLARAAFIATELLDDLVAEGVFTHADKSAFVAGLSLVSSELRRDFLVLDPETFLKRYGHLRPGAYDILSPRYDEEPETYFDWSRRHGEVGAAPAFRLTGRQRRAIDQLIARAGFSFATDRLMAFLAAAIRGREQAKFEFTRVLSDALVGIRETGKRLGFSTEDMSMVDVGRLRGLTGDPVPDAATLRSAVDAGRERYETGRLIAMPPLLTGPDDVWSFEPPDVRPNFVTQRRVRAPVAIVDTGTPVDGAIAFIAGADPGYDWLFARDIAGLVTAFGGANSHMALRALELDLPAVIGAGETLYRSWSQAEVLDIDAASELVIVPA
jgi:hypothetical protein